MPTRMWIRGTRSSLGSGCDRRARTRTRTQVVAQSRGIFHPCANVRAIFSQKLFVTAEKKHSRKNIFPHENFARRKMRITLRACASQAPEPIHNSDFFDPFTLITISCASLVQKLVDQSIRCGYSLRPRAMSFRNSDSNKTSRKFPISANPDRKGVTNHGS